MSDDRTNERETRRNEDPEAIAGAVSGAAGAGTGGAIGFAAGGPLGAAIGALAGAVGGWWAGREAQDAIEGADRSDNAFRRAHEHAGARRPFDEVRHGYQLGYVAGRNPDHASRDFGDVEKDLRTAWTQAHAGAEQAVEWEHVRDEARAGYEMGRSSRTD